MWCPGEGNKPWNNIRSKGSIDAELYWAFSRFQDTYLGAQLHAAQPRGACDLPNFFHKNKPSCSSRERRKLTAKFVVIQEHITSFATINPSNCPRLGIVAITTHDSLYLPYLSSTESSVCPRLSYFDTKRVSTYKKLGLFRNRIKSRLT